MKKFISQLVFAFSMIFFSSISNALPPSGPINHHYLYVVNEASQSIAYCRVHPSGIFLIPSSCGVMNLRGRHPNTIVVIPNTNYAYISSAQNDTISMCIINDADGRFLSCRSTDIAYADLDPLGIAVDNTGSVLYVAGTGNNPFLLACPINQENATIEHCNKAGNTDGGRRITLTNNSPFLYFIEPANRFSGFKDILDYCMRGYDNSLLDCYRMEPFIINGIERTPTDLITDAFGFHIYMTMTGGLVFSCAISAYYPSLMDCVVAYDIGSRQAESSELTSIATTPSGKYFYVGDRNRRTVYSCRVDEHGNNWGKEFIGCHGDRSSRGFTDIKSIAYR